MHTSRTQYSQRVYKTYYCIIYLAALGTWETTSFPPNSSVEKLCLLDILIRKEKNNVWPLGSLNIMVSLSGRQRSYATYRPHIIIFTLWQNVCKVIIVCTNTWYMGNIDDNYITKRYEHWHRYIMLLQLITLLPK